MESFACPDDGNPLSAVSPDEASCGLCGRHYMRVDGVWRFLPEAEDALLSEGERLQRSHYDEGAASLLDSARERMIHLHMRKAEGILEVARALVPADEGLRICEIGVGTAMHAEWLVQRLSVHRYFGVDISLQSLLAGSGRWEGMPGFVPVLGSAYRLPLFDGAVDLAFFSGSLHHCEWPARAIAEAARALRQGGVLVLSEPVWYYPSNLYYVLRMREERGQMRLRRRRVTGWVRDHGLTVERFEYFNFLPHPRSIRGLTEWIERILRRLPVLGRISSMFRCVARKQ